MKKKIGLLVDSALVSKRINDLVALSFSASNYEITALIVNDVQNSQTNFFSKNVGLTRQREIFVFLSKVLFGTVCRH